MIHYQVNNNTCLLKIECQKLKKIKPTHNTTNTEDLNLPHNDHTSNQFGGAITGL
jgi:hypothetical protein